MTLELLALMTLLFLLLTKEVVTNLPGEDNMQKLNFGLNLAIIPLTILFFGLVIARFGNILFA